MSARFIAKERMIVGNRRFIRVSSADGRKNIINAGEYIRQLIVSEKGIGKVMACMAEMSESERKKLSYLLKDSSSLQHNSAALARAEALFV